MENSETALKNMCDTKLWSLSLQCIVYLDPLFRYHCLFIAPLSVCSDANALDWLKLLTYT